MNNMTEKVKNFIENHSREIVCAMIVTGAYLLYSTSFDYGYKCREDFERFYDSETGSNIVEALNKFDSELF